MRNNKIVEDSREKGLIKKIRTLSADKIIEVHDFVDFLCQKSEDQRILQTSKKMSEDAFAKVWDNPEDDVYDNL